MTPTRYRLPAALGGGEYDGEMNSTGAVACLEIPGVGTIEVPGACLTEVGPPEPPVRTVFSNGLTAFVRCDPGTPGRAGDWYMTGDDTTQDWSTVARIVATERWRRYIPDPADDAPALPWKESNELTDDVHVANGVIWIEIQAGWHDADEARLRAAVILRAAREVEQP